MYINIISWYNLKLLVILIVSRHRVKIMMELFYVSVAKIIAFLMYSYSFLIDYINFTPPFRWSFIVILIDNVVFFVTFFQRLSFVCSEVHLNKETGRENLNTVLVCWLHLEIYVHLYFEVFDKICYMCTMWVHSDP